MNNAGKTFLLFLIPALVGWTDYVEAQSVSDEFKLKLNSRSKNPI